MAKRYDRTAEDYDRQLSLDEMNARSRQRQVQAQQLAQEREQAFLQPTGLQSMAGPVSGLDAQYGTEAGGMAYYQPVDFGSNVMTQDRFRGQGQEMMPQQVDPSLVSPLDDLEVKRGYTDVYYENLNKLNDLSKKAAQFGFNITKPNFNNPDQLTLHRAYQDLLKDTTGLGMELKHGEIYKQKSIDKGLLVEDRRGPTQREYLVDPKEKDFSVGQVNKMMKTYSDNGAVTKAESYKKEVVAKWEAKVQEFKAAGDLKQANVWEQAITNINDPTMDWNKVLDRNQRAEAARNRAKPQSGKETVIEELFMEVWGLQNWGQEGLLDSFPGAELKGVGKNRVLVHTDPKTNKEVRIPVNDHRSLLKFMVNAKDDWGKGISKEDIDKYYEAHGKWLPPEEDNFYIDVNVDGLNAAFKGGFDRGNMWDTWNDTSENKALMSNVADLLSYGADIDTSDGKGLVKHAVVKDDQYLTVTFEDGSKSDIKFGEHGSKLIGAINGMPKYNMMGAVRPMDRKKRGDFGTIDYSGSENPFIMKVETDIESRGRAIEEEESTEESNDESDYL